METAALSSIETRNYPPSARHWTYDDYYNLDDGKRYEVIEGELVMMTPAPTFRHQDIQARLGYLIFNHVLEKGLGKMVFSPVDIVLDKDMVFQPDIVFISNENMGIIKDAAVFGPPDIAVEILSPSSIHRDMEIKKGIYEKYGIKEYWLVFPDEKVVEIFALRDGRYELASSSEEDGHINSAVLDLKIDTADVF